MWALFRCCWSDTGDSLQKVPTINVHTRVFWASAVRSCLQCPDTSFILMCLSVSFIDLWLYCVMASTHLKHCHFLWVIMTWSLDSLEPLFSSFVFIHVTSFMREKQVLLCVNKLILQNRLWEVIVKKSSITLSHLVAPETLRAKKKSLLQEQSGMEYVKTDTEANAQRLCIKQMCSHNPIARLNTNCILASNLQYVCMCVCSPEAYTETQYVSTVQRHCKRPWGMVMIRMEEEVDPGCSGLLQPHSLTLEILNTAGRIENSLQLAFSLLHWADIRFCCQYHRGKFIEP